MIDKEKLCKVRQGDYMELSREGKAKMQAEEV